jgi:hypothetical protein
MAGAFGQPATSGEFSLKVGGKELLQSVPLDVAPITWSDEIGGGVPTMTFTVEDLNPWPADGVQPLKLGRKVRFSRNGVTLFAGHVIHLGYGKTIGGRLVTVTVAGFDAWLDWKLVPRWTNKKDTVGTGENKRIRYFGQDDTAVKRLIRSRAGFIPCGRFVSRTTGTNDDQKLGRVVIEQATLRTALEEVAEEANWDGITRRFYIDHNEEFHWYSGIESGEEAPFPVTDQEYAAIVTSHAGIVDYWPHGEGYATNYGRLGVVDLDVLGGPFSQSAERLVPNQPQSAIAVGSGDTLANVGGAGPLNCSGGWAWEQWVRFDAITGNVTLLLTNGGADDGIQVIMDTGGDITVTHRVLATATTFNTNLTTGTVYHLMVGQTSGGTNFCHVNGVAKTGTGTANLGGDGWVNFYVNYGITWPLEGLRGHTAWYEGATLPTAAESLAHYNAGRGIIVEAMATEHDAEDEYHKVYVVGSNQKGSGWFGPITNQRSEWEARAKEHFLTRNRCNTDLKRRKAGRNWLKRREPVHSGFFTVIDPVLAAGWKAGQVVEVTDAVLGDESGPYVAKRFAVAAVRGQYGPGPSEVRVDIDFGTIRRSVLRELR